MNIEEYGGKITSEMMELLLSADPDEVKIRSYLPESKILVCLDNKSCIGIAVLTVCDEIFELKNIAIVSNQQGKGIAKLIIAEIKILAKSLGATHIEVGTGNSSLSQLALYQKCGFRMSHIEPNFFEHYPEPIFENGIRCIDMVRLSARL